MSAQCIPAAESWLSHHTRLAPRQRQRLAALAPELMEGLPGAGPAAIGIGGPPGTGKSTLAGMLAAVCDASGIPAAVLSLDDYYLPQAHRRQLARKRHPLFAIRGVPGTHDLDRLADHLDRLLAGQVEALTLTRFDKAADERRPAGADWSGPPPRVVFLEGWCIGCPPKRPGSHWPARSEWERHEDPGGVWWQAVSDHVTRYDRRLNTRLARRWYLRPPSWDAVVAWRWRQERELGPRRRFQGPAEVADFLATYRRLCEYMEATCASWADRVIQLDERHRPRT